MMINGTIEHLVLGLVATLLALFLHRTAWPSVYVMLTVELVQADIYGWGTLLSRDTMHDLFMDAIGLAMAVAIYSIFRRGGAKNENGKSDRNILSLAHFFTLFAKPDKLL